MANNISEWFGHRVYPTAQANPSALADQRARRCPKCSQPSLIRQEGCDLCTSCGYSKCS